MLKRLFALAVICGALASPTMAQEKAGALDERAFAAEYKALVKKHPGANTRFRLFDHGNEKLAPKPRCEGNLCTWYPEVGVCECSEGGGHEKRLWE